MTRNPQAGSISITTNDEYSGTEGIITVEYLVEKIVGSISNEYDEDDSEYIIKISKKVFDR